ncbi:J domain-containing protein [Candidatus Dependentiae bacterium]|nr:J domain-containing protein [Candidatus Dependentiae bacterium]
MKKTVYITLMLILGSQALQAVQLKLLNKYSAPVQVEVYKNNSNTAQPYRLESNSPLKIAVGNIDDVERITIQPYGQLKQFTQIGQQEINLSEAKQLASRSGNKAIVLSINAGSLAGGWLSGWGGWTFTPEIETELRAKTANKETISTVFPRAVQAAKAGSPIYPYYILNFTPNATPNRDEIDKRRRDLLFQFHPDQMENKTLATQVSKIINTAHELALRLGINNQDKNQKGTLNPDLFKEELSDDDFVKLSLPSAASASANKNID